MCPRVAEICLEIAMEHKSIGSVLACFHGKIVLVYRDIIHGNIMLDISAMKINCWI
jgi:hypothetical protein